MATPLEPVPVDLAIAFMKAHYPDELDVVGYAEIEHISLGGTYGTTAGAQHSDPFPFLEKVVTLLTLLQFAYWAYKSGPGFIAELRPTPTALDIAKADHSRLIREEVIRTLRERHRIELSADDARLSDKAIAEAADFVEGKLRG